MILFSFMGKEMITTVISAISIILGSLIGAYFSWIITKKTTIQAIDEQYRIHEENRKYEEMYENRKLHKNACVIRLDISTALFQSIRGTQELKKGELQNIYPIPINKDYAYAVSSLSHKYTLKELSYIYQLYAVIEKVNYSILNCSACDKKADFDLGRGYESVVKKIYGENYEKIISINIDNLSYKELYENDFIKAGYKDVLKKLEDISDECLK